ncbi:MAG: hypothetical protein WC213_04215 [Arenimonas sp.]|jgi:hypothetical protein
MLNKLNGWQRIGTALTVLWLAYMAFIGVMAHPNLGNGGAPFVRFTPAVAEICTDADPLPDKKEYSFDEAFGCNGGKITPAIPERRQFLWAPFAIVALAPPLAAWLLVYALIFVIRWIVEGFRRKQT